MKSCKVVYEVYCVETQADGHCVYFHDEDQELDEKFIFDHPREGEFDDEFARRMVVEAFGESMLKYFNWGECVIGDFDHRQAKRGK